MLKRLSRSMAAAYRHTSDAAYILFQHGSLFGCKQGRLFLNASKLKSSQERIKHIKCRLLPQPRLSSTCALASERQLRVGIVYIVRMADAQANETAMRRLTSYILSHGTKRYQDSGARTPGPVSRETLRWATLPYVAPFHVKRIGVAVL